MLGFEDPYRPGRCDRLGPRQLADLRRYSIRQLQITNHEVPQSGPAKLLS